MNGCASGVARCDADGDVTSNREECDNISDADCSSDEDDTDYVTNISIETDLTELGSVLVFCV